MTKLDILRMITLYCAIVWLSLNAVRTYQKIQIEKKVLETLENAEEIRIGDPIEEEDDDAADA